MFVPSETMGSPKAMASHMPWAHAAQGYLEKKEMLDLLGDWRADDSTPDVSSMKNSVFSSISVQHETRLVKVFPRSNG